MAEWVNPENGQVIKFAPVYAGQTHPNPNDPSNPIHTGNATGASFEFSAEYRGANGGTGPGGVPGFRDPATGGWVEDWTGVMSMYGPASSAQRGMDLGYLTTPGSESGLQGGSAPGYRNYASEIPPAAQADPSHSWWAEKASGPYMGTDPMPWSNFQVWGDPGESFTRGPTGSPFVPHGGVIENWEKKVVGGAEAFDVGSSQALGDNNLRNLGLNPADFHTGKVSVEVVEALLGTPAEAEVAAEEEVETLIVTPDPEAVDFFDEPGITAQQWVLTHFPWARDLNLGEMIQAAVTEGLDDDVLIAQIRDTPQYRATFPGITDEQGRMRFENEQGYVDQVRQYRNVLIDAGSIGGRRIYDPVQENPVDYASLMERGISVGELQSRLDTYRDLTNNSAGVRAAFQTYANIDVSVDQLYQAVVDPAASESLIGQYNQNVLDADFDYSDWVANATEAALEATTETLSNLDEQGAIPEGALQAIQALSTEEAQGLVEALYFGDTEQGDSLLELDELVEAFQFALIGGAAVEQGLRAPSMERVGAFRQAGIDRARALKGYGAYSNQGQMIRSMLSRTNVQGQDVGEFGLEEFETALFLSGAEETDLLTRARQGENARARPRGGFATTARGARLAQPGRGAPAQY